jgi:hypothetical protein
VVVREVEVRDVEVDTREGRSRGSFSSERSCPKFHDGPSEMAGSRSLMRQVRRY